MRFWGFWLCNWCVFFWYWVVWIGLMVCCGDGFGNVFLLLWFLLVGVLVCWVCVCCLWWFVVVWLVWLFILLLRILCVCWGWCGFWVSVRCLLCWLWRWWWGRLWVWCGLGDRESWGWIWLLFSLGWVWIGCWWWFCSWLEFVFSCWLRGFRMLRWRCLLLLCMLWWSVGFCLFCWCWIVLFLGSLFWGRRWLVFCRLLKVWLLVLFCLRIFFSWC